MNGLAVSNTKSGTVGQCGSHLEGVGELAVSEGCAEMLDGDVAHCVVGEVCWFGGDKVWMSISEHVSVNFGERGGNDNNDNR